METVGVAASVVVGLLLMLLVVLVIVSIPDIARYWHIRRM